MNTEAIPAFTARRRTRGKTTTVIVTIGADPDAVLDRLGGKRAERAAAAIVVLWPEARMPGVYGLRADLHAAQAEVHRLVHRTHMVTRDRRGRPGTWIPMNNPTWAVAVPVEDDDRPA